MEATPFSLFTSFYTSPRSSALPGSLATLEEVVDFCDGGGNANPYQHPEIRPLGLDEDEKEALVAFLRSLTGVVREGS